jgi:hypothetical protein
MYVIFDRETTKAVKSKGGFSIMVFKTEGAAKAGRTRLYKKQDALAKKFANGPERYRNTPVIKYYEIAPYEYYISEIAKMVERRNAMTGDLFWEDINTPFTCSPSSETYWAS